MDRFDAENSGGSLQISSDVIEKIAKHAALEVNGVEAVHGQTTAARTLLGKLTSYGPIYVEMIDDVADIEVAIVVRYGTKIPEISEKVQRNVKDSVQNMTSITVGRVDIVVSGIDAKETETE